MVNQRISQESSPESLGEFLAQSAAKIQWTAEQQIAFLLEFIAQEGVAESFADNLTETVSYIAACQRREQRQRAE